MVDIEVAPEVTDTADVREYQLDECDITYMMLATTSEDVRQHVFFKRRTYYVKVQMLAARVNYIKGCTSQCEASQHLSVPAVSSE